MTAVPHPAPGAGRRSCADRPDPASGPPVV